MTFKPCKNCGAVVEMRGPQIYCAGCRPIMKRQKEKERYLRKIAGHETKRHPKTEEKVQKYVSKILSGANLEIKVLAAQAKAEGTSYGKLTADITAGLKEMWTAKQFAEFIFKRRKV